MSLSCGVECVFIFGCVRWAWKRCTYVGSDDSASWTSATLEEFEPIPRVCRVILAVYESDLRNPQFAPPGGYRLNPDWVVKRVTYEETLGNSPPYIIYIDHDHREIILAIRGLNLVRESDYKLLLNNKLGMQMFDGGYVHHGLLKSAVWLLNKESETLKRLWIDNGRSYRMIFAGHSLGSGVAALLTVIVVNHRDMLDGIPRPLIMCYAVAPARCMSLNLAVKYADVIYSVVLQDNLKRLWSFFYQLGPSLHHPHGDGLQGTGALTGHAEKIVNEVLSDQEEKMANWVDRLDIKVLNDCHLPKGIQLTYLIG